MMQRVSIFATRLDVKSRVSRIKERDAISSVRSSLTPRFGIIYPGFASPFHWREPDSDSDGHLFVLDKVNPPFDFHLRHDGSWIFTRSASDVERQGPVIFLEALTWELTLMMEFAIKLAIALQRGGEYYFGMTLSGFDSGFVDWSGFHSERIESVIERGNTLSDGEVKQHVALKRKSNESLGIWRYRPLSDTATEYQTVMLSNKRESEGGRFKRPQSAVASVMNGLCSSIYAESGYPQRRRKYRLIIDPDSFLNIVSSAWGHPPEKVG